MKLFTNSSSRRDFFNNAFASIGKTPIDVFIAVAFFTHSDPILSLAQNGSRIKLIVRLGYPTNPDALRSILHKEGIQVRFVNDRSFHPKLYIFSGLFAVVGSSNLTESALLTNQEVNISVEIDDPRYSELISLFVEWWDQSKVLDEESLSQYEETYDQCRTRSDNDSIIESDLQKKQGRITIKNIERGLKKPSASEIYLNHYKSVYAEFLDAYRTVERVYIETGKRKYADSDYPLRLEIDGYLSFIRESKTTGDSYYNEPILKGRELEDKIRSSVLEWMDTSWPWIDNEIIPKRYPIIKKVLNSPESINNASSTDIISALSTVHSFFDRRRFFKGGHETHAREFMEGNDLKQIKRTLTYLLYGKGDFVVRMAHCIYDPFYKLNQFGPSNVQELLGWINDQNIPICNNRTLRALRWLGVDIVVVGD